ncbi:MAG TPA: tagatose 1,6-diphosphate aldolase [Bryobacteraceae bacterium]|nr:tagatose 1,6-diphosphate aldolase [Bryobacteraceae bacterium]
MQLSQGKINHLNALSTKDGIIAAAAMDQRGSLRKMIAAGKNISPDNIVDDQLKEFKAAVSKILTPHASAILLDTEYGLPAAQVRAKNAGLLLAYEESGYDNTQPGRLPDLLPDLSALRIRGHGANAVKVLLYYTPFEKPEINEIKHAFIERVGAECETNEIPFFCEFVGYDPQGGDEKGLEYAKKKPEVVIGSMQEFGKQQYRIDVLKVEVPVNLNFVEGSQGFKGQSAYSRRQALDLFRKASDIAQKPFIYLSAGVSNPEFVESLEMAAEAGTDFSGVLCGRATWKNGVAVYAKQGVKALEDWLADEGVKNIEAVNNAVKTAKPWRKKAGISTAAA